jgi:nicotinamidase-related amidase
MNTKKALLIVDVQNDFISGSLPVQDGEQNRTPHCLRARPVPPPASTRM